MAEVEKNMKRQRAGVITKLLNGDISGIMLLEDIEKKDVDYLKVLRNTVQSKLKVVMELNEKIANSIEDDEDYQKILEENMDFEVYINVKLENIETFLKEQSSDSQNILTVSSVESRKGKNDIKLPTLKIKTFSGDPSDYQSFIESFTEAVHNNKNIPEVQKMNYLMGFLSGEAESLLKGFRLSGQSYPKALALLKERFGNPQKLISFHMSKIIDLQIVQDINDLKSLRKLYDSVETQLRNLETLNLKHDEYGPLLIPLLMNKMPNELQLILSRDASKDDRFDIQNVLKVFKKELEAREKISINKNYSSVSNEEFQQGRHGNSSFDKKDGPPKQKECAFCKREHKEQNCDLIKDKKLRKDIIIKEKRCFCCFKIGHSSKICRTNIKCFNCKEGRHHVAICLKNEKNNSSEKHDNSTESNKNNDEGERFSGVAGSSETGHVFLQTAKANVSSEQKTSKMRILFDLGSQVSYITPKAAKILNLKPVDQKQICIKSFNENSVNKVLDVMNFTVNGKNCNVPVTALCNEICHPLKNQNQNYISEIPEFSSLDFADSNTDDSPLIVDILIGADNYWKFVNDKAVRCPKGTLVAVSTKLGYILSGSSSKNPLKSHSLTTHVLDCQCEVNHNEFNETLKKFWDTENIKESVPNENQTVYEKFETEIKFNEDVKRYEVNLPFIEKYEILNDNFENSKRRLKSILIHKFKSNEKLLQEYDDIIKEQINLGIIEEVPISALNESKTFYLPHRPVCRDDRITTKTRMVFDASSSLHGPSLNDCLFPGPSLTTALFGILLRFRAKNIGLIADLEKAFWQIVLNEEDRDFVRFLWLKDIKNIDFENFDNNELATYRICRVLFGVTSSPFLLNGTIIHHVNKIENELLPKLILQSLHIDDLSTSLDNESEPFEFFKSCKLHFKDASFNLRKFQSNSTTLEQKVSDLFQGKNEVIGGKLTKVLGIPWDKESDS